MRLSTLAGAGVAGLMAMAGTGLALAADLDVGAQHGKLIEAFNGRQWQDVKALLAPGIVFHRGNGEEAFVGPDAVVGRFESTIGSPDAWNVKFARLDSDSQFTGSKGDVVERGDFAITAGGDDSACYAGSYMMTWSPDGDDWKLALLSWQDVETDLANCK